MKKMIMTMVAMVMMITSVSAQRIDNAYMEARFLTDKMVEELSLSSMLRETIYQLNLTYLNGIKAKDCYRFYTDIRRRKNHSRTYFLDRMQEKLNDKMRKDDELERMRR